MDQLLKEHERLEQRANLEKPIEDVQRIIEQLKAARDHIARDPRSSPMTLAKLQNPVKQSFNSLNDDLKEINSRLSKYFKALDKKFKDKPLSFAENDVLSSHPSLMNRAIAMHLLREGHFDVATIFIDEANANPPTAGPITHPSNTIFSYQTSSTPSNIEQSQIQSSHKAWEADFSPSALQSAKLQRDFSEMYHILYELRTNSNLSPAIAWARVNSVELETRGSNLEYDLCRLRYISLFTSPDLSEGPLAAIKYARSTLPHFPPRYATQSHALLGALAYAANIQESPYAALFSASTSPSTTATAATAFTSEFCALLHLSSASPLLTAVTAGCIALPTLLKLSQIQALHRTSWTTASELPVEVPLPSGYHFHNVFVCPVSKEQSTESNPPMMMPCGHVVARESLEKLSMGGRFKCPYCPMESHPKDAMVVFL